MPDIINKLSDSQISQAMDGKQIEKVLLNRLLPQLRAYEDGQKTILKANQGTSVEWVRFDSLEDIDGEVTTEGNAPASERLNLKPITATIKQYVRGINVTDRMLERGVHKVKAEMVELLSEAGAKTIDRLTINSMTGADCTKIYYANGKALTTITATDFITESDLEKAKVFLAGNNARHFEDGYYHALITPELASDVQKLASFKDKSKYQDPKGIGLLKGEIGVLNGIKFIETTNVPTVKAGASNAVTCHQLSIYGKGSYGVVDVEDEGSKGKPKHISKALGSSGVSDCANQRASEAIKFEFVAKILDDKQICKIVAPVAIVV